MKTTQAEIQELKSQGLTHSEIGKIFGVSRQRIQQITSEKYKAYQKAYQKSEKRKAYLKAYHKSEKYKAYQKSEKYKAYQKAYHKSEKYKAYQKAYQRVYQRRYYDNKRKSPRTLGMGVCQNECAKNPKEEK